MPKFMSSHTVPAGAFTREQINQIAQAAQNDPTVQPYRSFLNLSEGKIVCIMQAPDERALATWFQKMQMPCDSITAVELEGASAPSKKLEGERKRRRFGRSDKTRRCFRATHLSAQR